MFNDTNILNQSLCEIGFETVHHKVNYVLLFLDIVAAILNAFVIVAAKRLYRTTEDAVHIFIFSMTMADFVVTGFSSPVESLTTSHVIESPIICLSMHITAWLGLSASGLSLTLLNVEKLIYFRWPLHYENLTNERYCIAAVCLVWFGCGSFVALVWSLPRVITVDYTTCISGNVPSPWYELNTIAFCIFPVVSSSLLSIYLYQLTRDKRRRMSNICQNRANRTQKLRAFIFIFATTMWTAGSLLPSRIFSLLRLHTFTMMDLSCGLRQPIKWLAWILFYILMLNPVVNPFITVMIYAPYRNAFLKFMKFLLRPAIGQQRETETTFVTNFQSQPSFNDLKSSESKDLIKEKTNETLV